MSILDDVNRDGICDACGQGRSATTDQERYSGTGPYRRVKTKRTLALTGVRANVRIPGLLPGVADGAQPVAPLSLMGRARPYIYFSGVSYANKSIDVGIQLGYENGGNVIKPFSLPGPDKVPATTWTRKATVPLTAPLEIYMEFSQIEGISTFRLWTERAYEDGYEVVRGDFDLLHWQGPWKHYGFLTSIGAPENDFAIYDEEAWFCGVEWLTRQVRDASGWRMLKGSDLGTYGAYPQRGAPLNSTKVPKRTWDHECPIYVAGVDGDAWKVSREAVSIDMRRAKRG